MKYYEVVTVKDTNKTFLATLPAFPEAAAFGTTRFQTLRNLQDALIVTVGARIGDGEPIPVPLNGEPERDYTAVPVLLSMKCALFMGMRDKGISRDGLAELMEVPVERINRLLAVERNSHLDALRVALGHVGVTMQVTLTGTDF